MAIERCIECGANLALVGFRHRCIPRSDADGGLSQTFQFRDPAPHSEMRVFPAKRGRPRLGEVREKPWLKAGMSERTWRRRQREREVKP
jgi:hypothetical protein